MNGYEHKLIAAVVRRSNIAGGCVRGRGGPGPSPHLPREMLWQLARAGRQSVPVTPFAVTVTCEEV